MDKRTKSHGLLKRIDEMSRGKVRILTDQDIKGIGTELKKLNYNVTTLETKNSIDDPTIHKFANKKNFSVVLTGNLKDFVGLKNQKYLLIGIGGNLRSLNTTTQIAKAIECFFMKNLKIMLSGNTIHINLTSELLHANQCTHVKKGEQ